VLIKQTQADQVQHRFVPLEEIRVRSLRTCSYRPWKS
jgi:hypothetical protein